MRPSLSMRIPDPSRSRPKPWTVRPSGLMWVLIRTKAEKSASTPFAEGGDALQTAKKARASIGIDGLPTILPIASYYGGSARPAPLSTRSGLATMGRAAGHDQEDPNKKGGRWGGKVQSPLHHFI